MPTQNAAMKIPGKMSANAPPERNKSRSRATRPNKISGILRVRLRMSWMSDPTKEKISHREVDHGFGDVEALLIIADEASISCQPTDAALDYPATGNDLEP